MPFTAAATAGHWAGSPYERTDCELTTSQGKPLLTCGKWVVSVEETTRTILLADETCQSGVRWIERTGTLETSFFRFDVYEGPVPLQKWHFAGDDGSTTERWLEFTERDLGCA